MIVMTNMFAFSTAMKQLPKVAWRALTITRYNKYVSSRYIYSLGEFVLIAHLLIDLEYISVMHEKKNPGSS